MAAWKDYAHYRSPHKHTVTGDVVVLEGLRSPQLGNARDILVYLPPSYRTSDRKYPVIYMHDGQNLFDEHTSFVGEWAVDEAMDALSHEGLEAIVVGLPNAGVRRMYEYSPYWDRQAGGGGGAAYLSFIADTVKPIIDHDFRTRPEPAFTGTIGSSMGGLISVYTLFSRPDVFGFAGAMSPSIWCGRGALFSFIRRASPTNGRLYMDMGTHEGFPAHPLFRRIPSRLTAWLACHDTRRLWLLLNIKGFRPGHSLMYVEDEGAPHHESAWARRFPEAVRFLLQSAPTDA